jgi:hypothetical protein
MSRYVLLLCCPLLVAAAPPAPKEVRLADLLALPERDYRADPYLRVVVSLQALGKVKAVKLLQRLAAKEKSLVRLAVLCRMLYKAKGKAAFWILGVGNWMCLDSALEEVPGASPVEIVDGVPFFLGSMYILRGIPESETDYLRYCEKECEWNTERFKLRSNEEKRKALNKLKRMFDKNDLSFLGIRKDSGLSGGQKCPVFQGLHHITHLSVIGRVDVNCRIQDGAL